MGVAEFAMRTPLTAEQAHDLWRSIYEWERIRREAMRARGITDDGRIGLVDLEKSCLLGRLTLEGKDPLPHPPPTCNAAPWYDLIETGRADLHEFFVYGPDTGAHHTDPTVVTFNICGCLWEVERVDPLGHHYLRWPGYGEWRLRHRNAQDEPKVKGHWADGRETFFDEKDWVLERLGD